MNKEVLVGQLEEYIATLEADLDNARTMLARLQGANYVDEDTDADADADADAEDEAETDEAEVEGEEEPEVEAAPKRRGRPPKAQAAAAPKPVQNKKAATNGPSQGRKKPQWSPEAREKARLRMQRYWAGKRKEAKGA